MDQHFRLCVLCFIVSTERVISISIISIKSNQTFVEIYLHVSDRWDFIVDYKIR